MNWNDKVAPIRYETLIRLYRSLLVLGFLSLLGAGICLNAAPLLCGHKDAFGEYRSLTKAQPVMYYGPVDSRKELSEVMAKTKFFTPAEAKQLKKMVGLIYCPAGNGFKGSGATAFVMGVSNEIFTAGHLIVNDEGGRRDLSTCQFSNFANPRETFFIDAASKRTKILDWGPTVGDSRYDRVRLVLKKPVKGAPPLQPDSSETKLVGGEQLFTASATNRGFNSSYKDPIIAACKARDIVDPGDGMTRVKTDCDLSHGGSGAPLLYRKDGKLVVKGMSVTIASQTLPDGTAYDKDSNYQKSLIIDGEFLTWVNTDGKASKGSGQ